MDHHYQRTNAQQLEAVGMSPMIAPDFVEMYASLHNGKLSEDYYKNKPVVEGKTKLTDFAKDFAATFKQD